jgi:hypothetical protein
LERRWDHADDRVGLAIQRKRATGDCGIGTQPRSPEAFADNDDVRFRDDIGSDKGSTEDRADSKHPEKIQSGRLGGDLLRRSIRRLQRHAASRDSGHRLEGLVLLAPIDEVQERRFAPAEPVRAALRHHYQLVRFVEGKRSQQSSVGEREDRGIRADAKGQRQHRNCSKPWIFSKRPHSVSRVMEKMFENWQAFLIAIVLFEHFQCTEFQNGLPTRLLQRHASSDVFSGLRGKVLLDLFSQTNLVRTPSN